MSTTYTFNYVTRLSPTDGQPAGANTQWSVYSATTASTYTATENNDVLNIGSEGYNATYHSGNDLVDSKTSDGAIYTGGFHIYDGYYHDALNDVTGIVVFDDAFGRWYLVTVEDPGFTGGETVNTQLIDFGTALYCFGAGTAIATPHGEVAVERLAIGDTVTTADGGTARVRWIGLQTVAALPDPTGRRRPVLIQAGALGQGMPARDLRITADHALALDGVLVNAGALVNGSTIRLVDAKPAEVFYHVECEAHELVLAEGVAAETFIDYNDRKSFDNYGDYVARYGTPMRPLAEMTLPRVSAARLLPDALRARLGLDAEEELRLAV